MPFSYYRAPEAPAPDWGSLVHANLGARERKQAAVNALLQIASEHDRIKAAKQEKEADRAQEQTNFDTNQARLRADTQAETDRSIRTQEDITARQESEQEHQDLRALAGRVSSMLNTRYREQQHNERTQMEAAARAQEQEAKRQEKMQELQRLQKRNEAMQGAMEAIDKTRGAFPTQEFSAADVSPIFSTDPARMAASIKGSRYMAGREDTAADVLASMQKTKHAIPIAPPDWFATTLKPFAGDLTPQDQMSLSKYAHGADDVPYASSAAEARDRAVNYFAKHSEFAPLFAGSTSSSAPPPKAEQDPELLLQKKLGANKVYSNNQKIISEMRGYGGTLKPDQEANVKHLEETNKAIEDAYREGAGIKKPEAPAESDDSLLEKVSAEHPDWTPEQWVEEVTKRRGG